MSRPKRKCAPGWWWRGPATGAAMALPVLPMMGAGWVLAHLSDLIGRLP